MDRLGLNDLNATAARTLLEGPLRQRRDPYKLPALDQLRGKSRNTEPFTVTRTTSWRNAGVLDCDVLDRKVMEAHDLPRFLTQSIDVESRDYTYFGDLRRANFDRHFAASESGYALKFTRRRLIDRIMAAIDGILPFVLLEVRGPSTPWQKGSAFLLTPYRSPACNPSEIFKTRETVITFLEERGIDLEEAGFNKRLSGYLMPPLRLVLASGLERDDLALCPRACAAAYWRHR